MIKYKCERCKTKRDTKLDWTPRQKLQNQAGLLVTNGNVLMWCGFVLMMLVAAALCVESYDNRLYADNMAADIKELTVLSSQLWWSMLAAMLFIAGHISRGFGRLMQVSLVDSNPPATQTTGSSTQ